MRISWGFLCLQWGLTRIRRRNKQSKKSEIPKRHTLSQICMCTQKPYFSICHNYKATPVGCRRARKNAIKWRKSARIWKFHLLFVGLAAWRAKKLPNMFYAKHPTPNTQPSNHRSAFGRQLLTSYQKGGGTFMTALFTSVSASVCRHAHICMRRYREKKFNNNLNPFFLFSNMNKSKNKQFL